MSLAKAALSWLALPVYIWQGVGVRRRTERMAPADGPVTGSLAGKGETIRLLVVGDSSAASVGVKTTDKGLAPNLAGILSQRTGQPVEWRKAGFNSATAGQVRDFAVPNLAREPYTHIVLSIGTNDAKNFHTMRRFKREFGGLVYALKAKWPQARIVWSPVVDMTLVPAMPPALGKILEIRASLVNRLATRLCLERGAVPAARLPILDATGFSTDGFHASEAGYAYWAEHLTPFVLGPEFPVRSAGSAPSASSRRSPQAQSSRNRRASSGRAGRAGR
ncbi:MAG: SGNH/GDSL hydrolase family protein [Rhizobiaceae bacterium]|nr:SGNH/GDSL hydrolase family protein [Rhizobiaceae bacterium]